MSEIKRWVPTETMEEHSHGTHVQIDDHLDAMAKQKDTNAFQFGQIKSLRDAVYDREKMIAEQLLTIEQRDRELDMAQAQILKMRKAIDLVLALPVRTSTEGNKVTLDRPLTELHAFSQLADSIKRTE